MRVKTTVDMLQEHLAIEPTLLSGKYWYKERSKRILCKDGVTLSVQASESHYCSPRENFGPYSEVEIGFPSIAPPESWMEYCEDKDAPTSTVYAYVPIQLVVDFIDEHGGINLEATEAA